MSALQRLYVMVPSVQCQGKCVDSCGPIGLGMNELRAMQDEIGEAKPLTVDNTTLTCSFLRNGQCSAYAARPLLCRVFGVSRKMPCEFGCEPNHWLTEDEEQRLWRKWKEVAGPPLVSELTP